MGTHFTQICAIWVHPVGDRGHLPLPGSTFRASWLPRLRWQLDVGAGACCGLQEWQLEAGWTQGRGITECLPLRVVLPDPHGTETKEGAV